MREDDGMTLTEFLLARIAEDEEAAGDANGDRLWRWSQHDNMIIADAGHMQQFTPSRMLAECEAKRRLIDVHTWESRIDGIGHREPFGSDHEEPLRILAAVYAEHPDYDPDWRP